MNIPGLKVMSRAAGKLGRTLHLLPSKSVSPDYLQAKTVSNLSSQVDLGKANVVSSESPKEQGQPEQQPEFLKSATAVVVAQTSNEEQNGPDRAAGPNRVSSGSFVNLFNTETGSPAPVPYFQTSTATTRRSVSTDRSSAEALPAIEEIAGRLEALEKNSQIANTVPVISQRLLLAWHQEQSDLALRQQQQYDELMRQSPNMDPADFAVKFQDQNEKWKTENAELTQRWTAASKRLHDLMSEAKFLPLAQLSDLTSTLKDERTVSELDIAKQFNAPQVPSGGEQESVQMPASRPNASTKSWPNYKNYTIYKKSGDGSVTLKHKELPDTFIKLDRDGTWDQVAYKVADDRIAVRIPNKRVPGCFHIVTVSRDGRVIKLKDGNQEVSLDLLLEHPVDKGRVRFTTTQGIVSIKLHHPFFQPQSQR